MYLEDKLEDKEGVLLGVLGGRLKDNLEFL